MKEYRLKINGGYDFIIISPQTISLLISKIHNSPDKELAVKVEDGSWEQEVEIFYRFIGKID